AIKFPPVPIKATKGPGVPIGTGGNFIALIIGVIVFFIDIIVYIPFVRLNEQIWLKMQYIYLQEEKEGK
ncbi:PTS sugar transporter subunit IIC, partial [Lactobacillus salivarius]|nr:PTS sugar transporter subunit IIC [Ligilactobacillus salivarius]